jgi:hypothetical protein
MVDVAVLPRPFCSEGVPSGKAIAARYSQKKKRRQNEKDAVKTEKENFLTASQAFTK